jgi:hypothetical protein
MTGPEDPRRRNRTANDILTAFDTSRAIVDPCVGWPVPNHQYVSPEELDAACDDGCTHDSDTDGHPL